MGSRSVSAWRDLTALLEGAPGTLSAVVWCDGAMVYEYAADTVHAAASLIKVPLCMALLASDQQRRQTGNGLDLEATVTLRDADRVDGEGAFDQAPAGTLATYAALIGYALRDSDNTASNALIRALGMEQVNAFIHAAPLALQATVLRRHFMDWAAAAAGRENTTTAREMCQVFALLEREHERYAALLHWLVVSPYRDKLPAGVPDGMTVAHKVGDLPGVEHDAGIVYAPRGPYIVALLASNVPDATAARATLAAASRLVYEGFGI